LKLFGTFTYEVIRYDKTILTCAQKLTGNQFRLPRVAEKRNAIVNTTVSSAFISFTIETVPSRKRQQLGFS